MTGETGTTARAGTVALVTGASRGVGARTATLLAEAGADVAINYRTRRLLAERTARTVTELGRRALTLEADLTDAERTTWMFEQVKEAFGRLDVLVLNASGGLEQDRPPDYATCLNVEAQLRATDLALPLMPAGGRIVFVTSHHAHFHGSRPTVPEYEPIAASKKAGEERLRARLPKLAAKGVDLLVVSGDVIERTATAVLLERARPELFRQRRAVLGGQLLGVDEFASAVASVALAPSVTSGATVYVGSID
jgi:NAD(P)-dependent dehydrogenase (short-subunit alcohol dehydrogenase family)